MMLLFLVAYHVVVPSRVDHQFLLGTLALFYYDVKHSNYSGQSSLAAILFHHGFVVLTLLASHEK